MFTLYLIKVVLLAYFQYNFIVISGKYYISENKKPSYLYKKFDNIKEQVFPHDISINVSLTRLSGTLLYSMDRHTNQFIVSLSGGTTVTLCIEFIGQKFNISLSDLCKCERCRYTILNLRIQIRDFINLQCNDGKFYNIKYERTQQFIEDYSNSNNSYNNTSNEVHIWLLNSPQFDDTHSNQNQLSGCIFNVKYNNKEILFTYISKNIERNCKTTCVEDICNGGKCFETYYGRPICDCMTTFLNGAYCNETIYPMNINIIIQNLQFNIFKVSWKSNDYNIMELSNINVYFRLFYENNYLFIEYKYKTGFSTFIKSILSENYIPNTKYILLTYFYEDSVDVKFFNSVAWYKTRILTNSNIRHEIFTSLKLRSEEGLIDFVYKYSQKDYNWKKINIENYKEIQYDDFIPYKNLRVSKKYSMKTKMCKNDALKIVMIIFVSTIVLAFFFLIWIIHSYGLAKKKTFMKKCSSSSYSSTSLRRKRIKITKKLNRMEHVDSPQSVKTNSINSFMSDL